MVKVQFIDSKNNQKKHSLQKSAKSAMSAMKLFTTN